MSAINIFPLYKIVKGNELKILFEIDCLVQARKTILNQKQTFFFTPRFEATDFVAYILKTHQKNVENLQKGTENQILFPLPQAL